MNCHIRYEVKNRKLFPNGLVLKQNTRDSQNNLFKGWYVIFNNSPVTYLSPVDINEPRLFQKYSIYSLYDRNMELLENYNTIKGIEHHLSTGYYSITNPLEFLKIKNRHPESKLVRTTKKVKALQNSNSLT